LWLLFCLPPHLIARSLGRSHWPRRFLSGCARICGAEVRTEGEAPRPHALLLANHVSWLDIFVLAKATGCNFVSKAEIGDHPLVRWLADQNRTIYIRRSDRRQVGNQASDLAAALQARDNPITLFPEGTVGTGGRLLPFRPSLLAAVAPPPPEVVVQAVALDYGDVFPELDWEAGEHGVGNAIRLLGRRGRIPVTVKLLDRLAPTSDRKALARAAEQMVAAALAPSGIVRAAL
jgi:1-acyl-sn-glycerol-3-phosphate acyltransferase